MSNLRKLVPSTHSLHVFEAAARTLNFHLASKELNVTQPSVSHSVKALERHCGVTLFIRENRGVRLTEAGRILYDSVRAGFQRIEEGLRFISDAGTQYLTIAVSASLANHWLVPKLHDLQSDRATLRLKVVLTDKDIEPDSEIDLSIWVREKAFNRANSWYLCDEVVFPVCSPGFLASIPQIRSAADLAQHKLLHSFDAFRKRINWEEWLDARNVRPNKVEPTMLFNDYQIVLQSALAGKGIALAWNLTAQLLLKDGLLVKPIEEYVVPGGAFFAVAHEHSSKKDSLQMIVNWLLKQTNQLREDDRHSENASLSPTMSRKHDRL